jgi:cytochrome c
MGSRNPYRFSVDRKNNYLYWGDVGPDTKVMGEEGELMSYDEINQASEARLLWLALFSRKQSGLS